MPLKIIEENGELFQYRVERKNSGDIIVVNDDKYRETRSANQQSRIIIPKTAVTVQDKHDKHQLVISQEMLDNKQITNEIKSGHYHHHRQCQYPQSHAERPNDSNQYHVETLKTQSKYSHTRANNHHQQGTTQPDTLIESGEFTQELYERYEFDKASCPLYSNRSGKVLRCYDRQMPKLDLVVRVYNNAHWLRDEKLFITLLRRLAGESPHILGVQQTFFTDSKFCIIYEYAHHGNAYDYVLKYGNASLPEEQCQYWAKNIYQAMEYLKEMSIAHRSICPKHIMLVCDKENNDIIAKLWGFRSAISLSTENSHIMQLQPCWMFSCIAMFNFQAPEVFHNERSAYYDAIDADIWSFGATFLFILSGHYPYPVLGIKKCTDIELEKAIDDTLQFLPLSDDARDFFCALLVPNPRKRIDFRRIAYIPWMNIHSGELSI